MIDGSALRASPTARCAVPIGKELSPILDIARLSGLPVLLTGRHGIGNSAFLEHYTRERGIEPLVLDLSLLEATDLTGMPFIDAGLTRFAPPTTLPPSSVSHSTMLVLEELNRCDRSVRQPCLQLLTARRLNDYRLPERCFVAACVNPVEQGYDVDELDVALASGFVAVHVAPDREGWKQWARDAGLDEALVSFVGTYPNAFKASPPRTWTHAARLLAAARHNRFDAQGIERVLQTVLPPMAAHALVMNLGAGDPQLPNGLERATRPLDAPPGTPESPARRAFDRAVAEVLQRAPFHWVLLSTATIVEDESQPTMRVGCDLSGRLTLFYNPGFVLRISQEECCGVLVHEIDHVILGHVDGLPTRKSARRSSATALRFRARRSRSTCSDCPSPKAHRNATKSSVRVEPWPGPCAKAKTSPGGRPTPRCWSRPRHVSSDWPCAVMPGGTPT
jgi:hypothetical protein